MSPALSPADQVERWDSYWEELNAESWLYREQSELYVSKLAAAIPLRPDMRVLDFGCGFGFTAKLLADRVGEVWVWDASANMRRNTLMRLSDRANCHLLDLSDAAGASTEPRFDLILVNSVVQYMTVSEFTSWLVDWQTRLAPSGRVLVSDLIPPDLRSLSDVLDLLRFSRSRGLAWRALAQLAQGALNYSKRRNTFPLTRYNRQELDRLGQATGLRVSFLVENLTQFSRRTTASFELLQGR